MNLPNYLIQGTSLARSSPDSGIHVSDSEDDHQNLARVSPDSRVFQSDAPAESWSSKLSRYNKRFMPNFDFLRQNSDFVHNAKSTRENDEIGNELDMSRKRKISFVENSPLKKGRSQSPEELWGESDSDDQNIFPSQLSGQQAQIEYPKSSPTPSPLQSSVEMHSTVPLHVGRLAHLVQSGGSFSSADNVKNAKSSRENDGIGNELDMTRKRKISFIENSPLKIGRSQSPVELWDESDSDDLNISASQLSGQQAQIVYPESSPTPSPFQASVEMHSAVPLHIRRLAHLVQYGGSLSSAAQSQQLGKLPNIHQVQSYGQPLMYLATPRYPQALQYNSPTYMNQGQPSYPMQTFPQPQWSTYYPATQSSPQYWQPFPTASSNRPPFPLYPFNHYLPNGQNMMATIRQSLPVGQQDQGHAKLQDLWKSQ